MRIKAIIFILSLIVQISEHAGKNDSLHVSVLLEATQHGLSKYFSFFTDILEHAFQKIQNRTDILPEYSLKLITEDTQVTHYFY